jgi:hypothetical protein
MFLLYRLRLGAPIWPIQVGGPRVLPVWAHSSYATANEAIFTSLYSLTLDVHVTVRVVLDIRQFFLFVLSVFFALPPFKY